MEHNYSEEVKIDFENLEAEWLTQPSLVNYYNDLYAEAIFLRDQAKLKLEFKVAKMDLKVRNKPHLFGFGGKPTEAAIKNTVLIHKITQKYNLKLAKAQKHVNSMLGIKTSLDNRKKALENLVSMRITGVNADPKNIVKKLKQKGEEKYHKKQQKRLNKSIKSRNKKKG